MASFSRGLLRHALQPLPSSRLGLSGMSGISSMSRMSGLSAAPRPRLFTTSLPWHAAAGPKPAKLPPSRPSQSITGSSSQATTTRPSGGQTSYALVKSLAAKQTPTVLYESASHFWFYFGCWSSGLTILAWACLSGPGVVFEQPEGVPQFVGWVFGASYVLIAAMGFYLISKTPNIVSMIRVLPAASSAHKVAAGAAAGAAASAPAAVPSGLTMEVTVQRMLPLLQPKVLTVPMEKVSLKSRLSLPEAYVPELRRRELSRQAEQQQAALRRFDMEHLLTMPLRRLGRAFAAMFRGVKAACTDMGFGVIRIDGKQYKVNVERGFAHDGFRTLERIVPVVPK